MDTRSLTISSSAALVVAVALFSLGVVFDVPALETAAVCVVLVVSLAGIAWAVSGGAARLEGLGAGVLTASVLFLLICAGFVAQRLFG